MPTRYLKPGIRDSETIDRLSPLAECLFYRILVTVDDFGRYDARPAMVRAACFPVKVAVTVEACEKLMQELSSVGLVCFYEAAGKPYMQVLKWDNIPRAKDSKYPALSDTCIQLYTDADHPRAVAPLTVTVTVTETENRKPEQETGGQAATPPRRGRKPSEDRTLSDWIAATQERGEFAIPENDPVYATAQAAGLPAEFVQLAWFAFKRKYGPDGMSGNKKYKDWRVVFRTAVSENWAKLWMLDNLTNEFRLTTAGAQAQREFESQT